MPTEDSRAGDETDPFGRPYALVAAFENSAADERLYQDLIRGRWPLDAEALEYFLRQIRQASSCAGNAILAKLSCRSRARKSSFGRKSRHGSARSNLCLSKRIFGIAIVCFESIPRASQNKLFALIVDSQWVMRELFPNCRRTLEMDPDVALVSTGGRSGDKRDVRFKSLFPFWAISVPAVSRSAETLALRSSFVFAVAAVLCVAMLISGVVSANAMRGEQSS